MVDKIRGGNTWRVRELVDQRSGIDSTKRHIRGREVCEVAGQEVGIAGGREGGAEALPTVARSESRCIARGGI